MLDVFGALILAKSFIQTRPEDILRESTSYSGYNRFLARSLFLQRAEARIGGALLGAGFIFQAIGAYVARSDFGVINIVWIIAIVSAAAALSLSIAQRRGLRDFYRFFSRMEDPDVPIEPKSDRPDYLDQVAVLLGTERIGDEEDQAFARRLTAIKRERIRKHWKPTKKGGG